MGSVTERIKRKADIIRDRARGALLGLAVGDALGAQVEFSPRESFPHVTEMLGGGPHRLPPGYWTDDTSMALQLAESLCRTGGMLDPHDAALGFVRWFRDGELSSTGHCFDIGNTTATALTRLETSGHIDPVCGEFAAGNGSIMRLAPIPIAYLWSPQAAVAAARRQSFITHGGDEPMDACAVMASGMVWAMRREDPPTERELRPGKLSPALLQMFDFGAVQPTRDEVRGSGYVIESLQAALWAFRGAKDFEDAIVRAVNLGDDADTTGAVCGQIAGAWYGASGIPERWLQVLHRRDYIQDLADRLLQLAAKNSAKPFNEQLRDQTEGGAQ